MKVKNIYIRRVFKFCVFIFMLIILDFVIGSLLDFLYFHQKSGQQSDMTFVLTKCKAQVLIFGNSRAQYHYNTKILNDSIKPLTCFNSGIDGGHSNLLFYALIKEILKRYHPKLIILEFEPTSVIFDRAHYDLLAVLLPYHNLYPDLDPIIGLRSPLESIKLCSRIYPYNSNIFNLIRYNLTASSRNSTGGYIPMYSTMDIKQLPDFSISTTDPLKVDPWKIKALENTIQLCRKTNVKLIIINSPIYKIRVQHKKALDQISQVTERYFRRYKVNYIDLSDNPLFLSHPEWFKDRAHLNSEGADVFSSLIGGILRKNFINDSANAAPCLVNP